MINTDSKIGISHEEKQRIAKDLEAYVISNAGGSRNKASKMLNKVSVSYISQILNGKFDAMSDNAWRTIKNQVSVRFDGDWKVVNDTTNMLRLHKFFIDAKKHSLTTFIVGHAGSEKTEAAKEFAKNENVFLIRCNEYFNKTAFLKEIIKVMGIRVDGRSCYDMMNGIVDALLRMDNPILIFDEAEKLKNDVLYFFISFYNALEYRCGLILMGSHFFEARVKRGLELGKKGFEEIYSRGGGKFIHINKPLPEDVRKIINLNGVHDEMEVSRILNDSNSDLRRVRKLTQAFLRAQAA